MTAPPLAASAIRVLGIAGSLRRASYNRALLRAAIELAPESMTIDIWDRVGELPLYNADLDTESPPAVVVALRNAVRSADALLFVTPEYNYGTPAPLKNAIDWASRPPATASLKGKPAGIIGAATGLIGGTARGQDALRQSFIYTQTYALQAPEILITNAKEKFDTDLRLTDEKTREALKQYLVRLKEWALRFR
jgi:chromate reductase, NAD(P)H dehydrogenase (quinone)